MKNYIDHKWPTFCKQGKMSLRRKGVYSLTILNSQCTKIINSLDKLYVT